MECDWEVELGGDTAVIDAAWEGFVDLRLAPDSAAALHETQQVPTLAEVLVRLNSPDSPVWTAKCDVWSPGSIDPDELDAPPASTACAIACYIDLLPATSRTWSTAESAIAWCKQQCGVLRSHPLRCCRTDLIVRNAILSPDKFDVGVTAYFTAAGLNSSDATHNLAAAFSVFVASINFTRMRK